MAGVFDLSVADIEQVARDVHGAGLWSACRARAGAAVGTLAQTVTPRAGWADLVLPEQQLEQLRALVSAVRHRTRVLHDWGFAERTARGLGSTALFAGASGTGKTLAAEVIARELDLDLVIVDLSQVVSKYIGETEKHLRRVFDAAEDGGCVLLFDEADTLFGKRSEVRDSHDRYANLEVGYLLQRMESFRGLAILATNARDALDPAFTRRLRTIVTFPYPDPDLRQKLWEKAFPPATPVADLDTRQLAGVDVPGGGIASIALTAAYLAAETEGPCRPRQRPHRRALGAGEERTPRTHSARWRCTQWHSANSSMTIADAARHERTDRIHVTAGHRRLQATPGQQVTAIPLHQHPRRPGRRGSPGGCLLHDVRELQRDADESALALRAHAYRFGRHVVMAPGQCQPHTDVGVRLPAHELAHVVQQGNPGWGVGEPSMLSTAQDASEHIAEHPANRLSSGHADCRNARPHEFRIRTYKEIREMLDRVPASRVDHGGAALQTTARYVNLRACAGAGTAAIPGERVALMAHIPGLPGRRQS